VTETLSPDLAEALLDDCRQNITIINQELSGAQYARTEVSPDLVNRLFRAFHSIKVAAAYLGSSPLTSLSELAEKVVAEVRDHGLVPSTPVIDALLASADRMDEMVRDFELRSDFQVSAEIEKLASVLRASTSPMPAETSGVTGKAASPAGRSAPAKAQLKILVVEDDFSCRVLLQALMAKYGDCHVAVNGREAVVAFTGALEEGEPYDLICMDINMPGMGGKEAVNRIRMIEKSKGRISNGVRIFMTTSLRDMKTIVASFKLLCDAYLFKPINGAELDDHLLSFGLIKTPAGAAKALMPAAK
jgi:two-component system chemotaxis response regulator CheY